MAWMSEEAAATVLGVSFKTIRRRVGNGSIRAMRQGRQIFVDIETTRIAGPNRLTASTRLNAAIANTGSTSVATTDTPVSEPVGTIPPTRVPPVTPMPVKPLADPTLSIALSPSPMPTNAVSISSKELLPERWPWLAIWLLLTLLLTASTVAAWIYQQGQSQLQEAESHYQQVMLDTQQAQAKQAKQITATAERERKLIGELSTAYAKFDETNRALAEQQNTTDKFKADLDKTVADLTNSQSERNAIANKLISAQATAQVLRWQAALGDTFRQLAERIPQPKQQSRTAPDRSRTTIDQSRAIPQQPVDINDHDWTRTTQANAPATKTANAPAAPANASNVSDENIVYHRPLPHQPATLSQEDARAALRAIVKTDQSNAVDATTTNQTGITPEQN